MALSCPHCAQPLQVGPEFYGVVADCPRCGKGIKFSAPRTRGALPPQPMALNDPGPETGTMTAMAIGMWHFGIAYGRVWFGALINFWPFLAGIELAKGGKNLDHLSTTSLGQVASKISGVALSIWALVGLAAFLVLGAAVGPGAARERRKRTMEEGVPPQQ